MSQDIEDTFAACLRRGELAGRTLPGMSKARLVITAVTVGKRPVQRGGPVLWGGPVLGLHAARPVPGQGEAAFEPRSRRPRTSPSAISPGTVELIVRLRKDLAGQGLDAGPADHLLAPGTPPPDPGLGGYRQPHPGPPGPGHPRSRPSGRGRPTSGSPPSSPTSAGSPTSPTTPLRRAGHRDPDLAG